MYAILFRALAKSTKREDLLEFLKRDCQESRDLEPGTLRFDVLEDPENRNAFYVFEAYVSMDAFAEHKKGEAFKEWERRIQPELAAFKILFMGEPEAILTRPSGTCQQE
jgi:quinol monooxygenase YgiN